MIRSIAWDPSLISSLAVGPRDAKAVVLVLRHDLDVVSVGEAIAGSLCRNPDSLRLTAVRAVVPPVEPDPPRAFMDDDVVSRGVSAEAKKSTASKTVRAFDQV